MKKFLIFLAFATLAWSCSDKDEVYTEYHVFEQALKFEMGQTLTVELDKSSAYGTNTAFVGWQTRLTTDGFEITAPTQDSITNHGAPQAVEFILRISHKTGIIQYNIPARVYQSKEFDFEDLYVADPVTSRYLAHDPKGSNFYSVYEGTKFTRYTHPDSGLTFGLNSGTYEGVTSYDFGYGGIVLSTFNDRREGLGWENQCSVYFPAPGEDGVVEEGPGGYNGSNVFAVHYGSQEAWFDSRTSLEFADGQVGKFVSFYYTNSTYTYDVIMNGDDEFGARPLPETEGRLWVIVEGFNGDESVGTKEFDLANFVGSNNKVVTSWELFTFPDWGPVTKVVFDVQGTDVGDYGLNTPKYFCFDNLTVKY